jgi:hypothetical protein
MHKLGTKFTTTLTSGKTTTPIVDVPKWDFNDQITYPVDPATTLVRPGDTLTTTCTYTNPTDKAVTFGEKTENEMCLNFIMVYPLKAIASLKGEWCSSLF